MIKKICVFVKSVKKFYCCFLKFDICDDFQTKKNKEKSEVQICNFYIPSVFFFKTVN